MSDLKDYPVRVFAWAATSVVGWWTVIFATAVAGCWLGACLGEMQLFSPLQGLFLLFVLAFNPIGWIFCPQVFVGYVFAFYAFSVPLVTDVRRPWLLALLNFLVWAAIVLLATRWYPNWNVGR